MEYTLACIWCYYYDDGLELINTAHVYHALFCHVLCNLLTMSPGHKLQVGWLACKTQPAMCTYIHVPALHTVQTLHLICR